jgi:hypothetical protein
MDKITIKELEILFGLVIDKLNRDKFSETPVDIGDIGM